MEYWTNDSSYYHGCHGRWSIDDMVSARMRGNQTIRTEKTIGVLRREELWDARPAITKDIRAEFEDRILFERKRAREKLNLPPELDKSRAGQAIVDRIAIPRALCGMGFLEYRKERISELIFQE